MDWFFYHFPVRQKKIPTIFLGMVYLMGAKICLAQTSTPKVVVPTGVRSTAPSVRASTNLIATISYPWKTHITCTVFWIGETPTARNPTPNNKSSWDQNWSSNFGGYDDPEPTNRIADHTRGDFRPKNFIPKLNPFYVALPYNDVEGYGRHKAEAQRVIPWFSKSRPSPGQTVCKGRWVQIFNGRKYCFAQWEDCGPWTTDDWEFVFGTKPPKTTQNGAAGIDLSPAIRDYLSLSSGRKVHWRFIEACAVPSGPWKKYGQQQIQAPQNFVTNHQYSSPALAAPMPDAAQLRNIAYLRKARAEQNQKEQKAALQLRQN